jgi:CDP-diacylglycerol--glycerol-3-phosphate 3-phosphatidyltransferase
MNTPNKLTVLRILLVPFFVAFLLLPAVPHHYLIAGLFFAVAAITDHFDGKIARSTGQITDFGKFADPLADKILVMSAFLCFIELGLIGSVAVILMLFREFLVTSIRLVAAGKGRVLAANIWGKAKTVSQITAVLVVITLQYVRELLTLGVLSAGWFNGADVPSLFYWIGNAAVWIAVVFTLISGAIYLWENRDLVRNAK